MTLFKLKKFPKQLKIILGLVTPSLDLDCLYQQCFFSHLSLYGEKLLLLLGFQSDFNRTVQSVIESNK